MRFGVLEAVMLGIGVLCVVRVVQGDRVQEEHKQRNVQEAREFLSRLPFRVS